MNIGRKEEVSLGRRRARILVEGLEWEKNVNFPVKVAKSMPPLTLRLWKEGRQEPPSRGLG